ncbi:MAG: cell division protein FtsQ/DivIB [Solirubrobacteraceae bacterium]
MSRSLAAAPARRRATRPGSGRRASEATHSGLGVLRPLTGVASLARAGAVFVLRRRRLRFALLAVVIAMPLLGGGWLWLRKSSFVAVQQVQITGVHGPEAQAVQAALAQAAHGMSTLAVSDAALRAAVAPLRVVRSVRAIPRFPHGLRIEVSEQLPVAALTVAGVRTAVAADGVVLGPALLSGSLPSVSGYAVPAPGKRVHGAGLLAALTVLGAAPAPLAKHVERVFTGAKGLTAAMRNGLLVYFGDAGRPHAKWLSLARVLADSSSAGASYVDVRLPSHPAAGFPAGVTPPDTSTATSTAPGEALGSSESAVASLAAGLSSGSATTSPTGTEAGAPAAGTSAPSPQGSEASTGEAGAGGQPGSSQTSTEPGG